MNLSSGLKPFLDRRAKAAELGAAFPLLSLSASQQVWGLKLWLPSAPLTGLKGESCAASPASVSLPRGGWGDGAFQLLVAARGAPRRASGVLWLWAEQPCVSLLTLSLTISALQLMLVSASVSHSAKIIALKIWIISHPSGKIDHLHKR